MTNRPLMTKFNSLPPLDMQRYERYLPTAFDESLSILEKINKLIEQVNVLGDTSNKVVDQWNNVMQWIMTDGLNMAILQRLTLWLDDGTLEAIINDQLLNNKADKADLDELQQDFTDLSDGLNQRILNYVDVLEDTMQNEMTAFQTQINNRINNLEENSLADHDKYIDHGGNLKIIYVPTDYPTIHDALMDISSHQLRGNLNIQIEIEQGHRPTRGTTLTGGDYGQVTIVSEANHVVQVADSFTGRFISTDMATAPTLGCFVDGRGRADRIYSVSTGQGKVLTGCGGRNTTGRILYAYNAHVSAGGSVWENFADQIYASSGGGIDMGGSEVRGGTITSNGSVVASRGSAIEGQNMLIENCAMGVEVKRSSAFNAHQATFRNISRRAIMSWRASQCSVDESHFSGIGEECLYILGGMLTAVDVTITTANNTQHPAVYVIGGEVTLTRAIINGFRDGIDARSCAQVSAGGCTITSAVRHGVVAQQGANINLKDASSRNNGTNDLYILDGGVIMARGCDTTNSTGSPALINTNLTGAFNTIDTYRGIIWG